MSEEQALNTKEIIYIKLLNEDLNVWIPVEAIKIYNDLYKIYDDINEESSEFKDGETVKVKNKIFSDGTRGLVAHKRGIGVSRHLK